MLTHETMGLWALGISWLTALLVALDLGIDFRRLGQLQGKFRRSLLEAEVLTENFARHVLEQRVRRLLAKTPTLGFWDRSHTSHITGGTVRVGTGTLAVSGTAGCEVWTSSDQKQAAARMGTTEFDALFEQAKRKAVRTIETRVVQGDRVWLAGERKGERFDADIVSAFDPRPSLRKLRGRILALWLLDLAWVAMGTGLALSTPHFGTLSTVGAVVLLAHFLGITPIAVALRERCRSPALAFVRGRLSRESIVQGSK